MPAKMWPDLSSLYNTETTEDSSSQPLHAGQQALGNQAMIDRLMGQDIGDDLSNADSTVKLSEAAPSASKIISGTIKLISVGEKLKEEGTGVLWDDEELLTSARNILGLAGAVNNIGHGIAGIAKDDIAVDADTVGKTIKHATNLINAADLLARVHDQDAAKAFMDDPSDLDKAEDWASDVTSTFSSAAELIGAIPDGGLPGYIKTYWQGLMKAPKNYVDAFIIILKTYLGEIDEASGSWVTAKVVGPDNKSLWEGPLAGLYNKAQHSKPAGLEGFMRAHRKIDGYDLWETSGELGRSLLLMALYTEIGHGESEEGAHDKQPWIDLVADFLP